jgi:hypothetical protein
VSRPALPGITSEGHEPTSRPQLVRVNLAPRAHGVNAMRPLTNKQSVRFSVVACTRTKIWPLPGEELNLRPRASTRRPREGTAGYEAIRSLLTRMLESLVPTAGLGIAAPIA